MAIQQISVFLENREGQLAEITSVLAENNIDLKALHISETSDYGVLRLISADYASAEKVLRDNGFLVNLTPVVCVAVDNKPGGLCGLLKVLSDNKTDISYMYSVFGEENGSAKMIIKVRDITALEKILADNGIEQANLI